MSQIVQSQNTIDFEIDMNLIVSVDPFHPLKKNTYIKHDFKSNKSK